MDRTLQKSTGRLLRETQLRSLKPATWKASGLTLWVALRPLSHPLLVTLSARFLVTLVRFVFSWVDTFWSTSNHLWTGRQAWEECPETCSCGPAHPSHWHIPARTPACSSNTCTRLSRCITHLHVPQHICPLAHTGTCPSIPVTHLHVPLKHMHAPQHTCDTGAHLHAPQHAHKTRTLQSERALRPLNRIA